jgi:hypothetical protein
MEEWEGKHEGERGERENNETETAIVKSFPPGPEVVGGMVWPLRERR